MRSISDISIHMYKSIVYVGVFRVLGTMGQVNLSLFACRVIQFSSDRQFVFCLCRSVSGLEECEVTLHCIVAALALTLARVLCMYVSCNAVNSLFDPILA